MNSSITIYCESNVQNREGIMHHPSRDLYYYERQEPNGNLLIEDRAATFRKQSIAIVIPAVSRERAFRVKVPVALVAFRRFFIDIYHTASYGEVGQPQTLHHLPSSISDPVSYLEVPVTRGVCQLPLIDPTSCLLPRKLFFFIFPLYDYLCRLRVSARIYGISRLIVQTGN